MDRWLNTSASALAILAVAGGSLFPTTARADFIMDGDNAVVSCTSCTNAELKLVQWFSKNSVAYGTTSATNAYAADTGISTINGRVITSNTVDNTTTFTVGTATITSSYVPGTDTLTASEAQKLYAALSPIATASGQNASTLNAISNYTGSNSSMLSLSNAVNNLTSAAEIEKAGAQLRPEINGGTTQASLQAVNQALSTIQVRADAVRTASADAESGISSGETLKGLGMWGQTFGSYANQDRRENVDGYDATTYGLAFGADARVIDPLRVGLSLAYARTDVDADGSRAGSGQDISSYIASLYGTYTAKTWYMDAALTFGWHEYDATRLINIPGTPSQMARASYAGQQYGAKTEFGYPLEVGRAVVTPIASLAYNRLHQNGYTETGAAAALRVASSDTDSIRSGLGSKISATVGTLGEWNIRPNARVVWLHEFNGSAQDSTSSYVDGGSSFTTSGVKVAREHFNIGVGLDMASVRNTTISGKYDVDLADRYISHTGSLQIRTEF